MPQFFSFSLLISLIILLAFYFMSKNEKWDTLSSSGFECGFSSYFSSRFSFCVHYFLVSLIFLFFDLELSFIFLFFLSESCSPLLCLSVCFFILLLLGGLLLEWLEFNLDWLY